MAASNPANVVFGVLGGLAGAAGMFYSVASGAIFPRYTPPDQNDAWQTRSEDLMAEGKWVCFGPQRTCCAKQDVRHALSPGRNVGRRYLVSA